MPDKAVDRTRPLEVTYMMRFDCKDMDDDVNERVILGMRDAARSSHDIVDALGLKRRIEELIHLNTVLLCATKLETVNRIFGRKARQLNVSLVAIWDELLAEQNVMALQDVKARMAISTKVRDELREFLGPEDYRENALPNMIQHAL